MLSGNLHNGLVHQSLFAELISEAVDIFWKEEKEVPFKEKLDRFNRSATPFLHKICYE
jgi:hypothetical protein